MATLSSTGTPTYHHADHLSVRVTTDTSGVVVAQQGHYPFGESWYQGSGGTKWQFTSYERDSESGLDYAMFRYDLTRLGRFLTPDPIAGSVANPQSLNRYTYVLNDPVNLVDPLGLHDTGSYHVHDSITVTAQAPVIEPEDVAQAPVARGPLADYYLFLLVGRGSRPHEIPLPAPRGPGGQQENETVQRAVTCAKAYYGLGTIASRGAIAAAGAPIPRALFGLPRALGSGPFTTLPSVLSLGGGTAASGTNLLRIAGRVAVPIFVATVVIDAAAITICTFIDQ